MRGWVLMLGVVSAVACGRTPTPVAPRPPVANPPALVPSLWPDVTTPLPSENTGSRDAAVVVAVEQYPELPGIVGARRNAEDWGRFFVRLLGVPESRVTQLYDSKATRAAILGAVEHGAAQAEPGGRLWFVFIGHGQASLVPSDAGNGRDGQRLFSEADVEHAAARESVQLVSVLDVGFDKNVVARLGVRPSLPRAAGPLPIVLGAAPGGPLPGDGRPAISYLLLGALRGWADSDGDGRVTAREAVEFTQHALTKTAGWHKEPARPYVGGIDCDERMTVLSTLREPAPNVTEIVPPPRERTATKAAMTAATDAVAKADEQLQRAILLHEERGQQEGFPERREPTFVGEGESQKIEVVAMPSEVRRSVAARAAEAAKLGGPEVAKAAQFLLEAALSLRAYGELGPARAHLLAVMRARCGKDELGFVAWQNLLGIASIERNGAELERLWKTDCTFDEASEKSVQVVREPLSIRGYREAQLLYREAPQQADPEVARCTWSAAAKAYEVLLREAPARLEQAEAAMNGAHAYRLVGQPEAAASMYRLFLRAQAEGIAEDSAKLAATRHGYSILACEQYGILAREVPSLIPDFAEICDHPKWLDCTREREACDEIANAKSSPISGALASTLEEDAAEILSGRARGREELAGWEWREPDRALRRREALEQYRAAEKAWFSIGDHAGHQRQRRGFDLLRLAEARTRIVVLSREMGDEPTAEEIALAEAAARAARDVSFDDKRRKAALLLVDIADSALPNAENGDSTVTRELPSAVRNAIRARDEYLGQIQATRDVGGTRGRYTLETARWLVQYGQLGAARLPLVPDDPAPPKEWSAATNYRALALLYTGESARRDLSRDMRLEAARKAIELCSRRGVPGTLLALAKTLAELHAPATEQRNAEKLAERAAADLERGAEL